MILFRPGRWFYFDETHFQHTLVFGASLSTVTKVTCGIVTKVTMQGTLQEAFHCIRSRGGGTERSVASKAAGATPNSTRQSSFLWKARRISLSRELCSCLPRVRVSRQLLDSISCLSCASISSGPPKRLKFGIATFTYFVCCYSQCNAQRCPGTEQSLLFSLLLSLLAPILKQVWFKT